MNDFLLTVIGLLCVLGLVLLYGACEEAVACWRDRRRHR